MNLERDYSGDYFQLYSIKKEFLLDLSELKLKQKMLLQKMHPDLFVNSTAVEKKVASDFATLVNKAFGSLSDPLTRGEHLCSILGLQFDMENFKLTCEDLLEKQFEIRSKLEEIKKNNSSKKFFKLDAKKHFPATGQASLSGVIVDCNKDTGLADKINSFILGGDLTNTN